MIPVYTGHFTVDMTPEHSRWTWVACTELYLELTFQRYQSQWSLPSSKSHLQNFSRLRLLLALAPHLVRLYMYMSLLREKIIIRLSGSRFRNLLKLYAVNVLYFPLPLGSYRKLKSLFLSLCNKADKWHRPINIIIVKSNFTVSNCL